jgi:phage-related minor tail protein
MARVLGFQIEINGTQRAISTSEELRRAIADIGKELKKATDVETIKKLEKELIDLRARQAEVNQETRESIRLQRQQLTAVDNTSGAYDKLSKELNEARKRYKDLAAAEMESSEEAQQLIKRIVELDSKLKGVDASVGQFQRNVGNYSSALDNFFPQLGGISQGINDVRNATNNTGKAIAGIAIGFEVFNLASAAVAELNANLEETRQIATQIQTFTGATGSALLDQVAQAKAVAETYKANVQEVSVAANTLSRELGVDFARALELIEAGFRKGANAQGEFLDGLREYPAQFRDAGASAEQFIAVSIAAANSGIYSDKGLDAVKEFGLRIREQTKATADALTNSLGKKFTDELFKGINDGSITTVDALGNVTRALKANGVAGAALQGVIADVFGGPGEDVGQQFLFTLGDILDTTDSVTCCCWY